MKVDITVPSVGESVTEATVSQILKTSGSSVSKDDEILELETDKLNQVIHSPESGILTLSVSEEDTVKIGQVIGHIDTDGTPSSEPLPAGKKSEPKKMPKEDSTPKKQAVSSASTSEKSVRISKEEYVQNIGKESQTSSPTQPKPEKAPEPPTKLTGQTRKRLSGLRKTIAQRLVEVKNQTAMLTTFNEVDMSKIMEIRSKEKEAFEKRHGVKLGFLSFFVSACSKALTEFPDINAFFDNDEIVYNDSQNIGIAVSTEKGLMVPVLKHCEDMSFSDIESNVANFAKKAREGTISIDDLQEGTFTITNGGVFGSLLSTPILNPPQSAILGMHKIMSRPVVVDNEIVIRPMMYLALSYDHRIVDGKESVSFLVRVKEMLESPTKLLLD